MMLEGEPVKLLEGKEEQSFIYLGVPHIEYFKSVYIKLEINDSIYQANQINLN